MNMNEHLKASRLRFLRFSMGRDDGTDTRRADANGHFTVLSVSSLLSVGAWAAESIYLIFFLSYD